MDVAAGDAAVLGADPATLSETITVSNIVSRMPPGKARIGLRWSQIPARRWGSDRLHRRDRADCDHRSPLRPDMDAGRRADSSDRALEPGALTTSAGRRRRSNWSARTAAARRCDRYVARVSDRLEPADDAHAACRRSWRPDRRAHVIDTVVFRRTRSAARSGRAVEHCRPPFTPPGRGVCRLLQGKQHRPGSGSRWHQRLAVGGVRRAVERAAEWRRHAAVTTGRRRDRSAGNRRRGRDPDWDIGENHAATKRATIPRAGGSQFLGFLPDGDLLVGVFDVDPSVTVAENLRGDAPGPARLPPRGDRAHVGPRRTARVVVLTLDGEYLLSAVWKGVFVPKPRSWTRQPEEELVEARGRAGRRAEDPHLGRRPRGRGEPRAVALRLLDARRGGASTVPAPDGSAYLLFRESMPELGPAPLRFGNNVPELVHFPLDGSGKATAYTIPEVASAPENSFAPQASPNGNDLVIPAAGLL